MVLAIKDGKLQFQMPEGLNGGKFINYISLKNKLLFGGLREHVLQLNHKW